MEFTDEELQEIQTMLRFAYGQSQHTDLSEEIRAKIEEYFERQAKPQALYSVKKIQHLAFVAFGNQLDDLQMIDEVPMFSDSKDVGIAKGLGIVNHEFVVQGDYIEWLEQNEMSEFAEDVKRLCVFKS